MNPINIEDLKKAIRDVPDFPKQGILFKDITTALKNPELFAYIIDCLFDYYKNLGITKVAAIESRGFIIGGALAYKLGAGFVPIRKPGKLPSEKYSVEYELEYGSDIIEIHKDALNEDDVVLIHDDLLATGGTALATSKLVSFCGVQSVSFSFLCELCFLNGSEKIRPIGNVHSLVCF
jgi:adenine phosphoribosyltransferase